MKDINTLKQELKEKIAYTGIDVDDLIARYTQTLWENNNPRATELGTLVALNEWAKKEYLIRQVMAMPGYNGNLQAVVQLEVPIKRKQSVVKDAVDAINRRVFGNGNKVLSRKNGEGKTVEDKIAESFNDIPETISINDLQGKYDNKESLTFPEFTFDGFTKESVKKKTQTQDLINYFRWNTNSKIDADTASCLNKLNPDIRAAEGMKTTRALGKIIKLYGLEDKSKGSAYSQEFISKYCEIMRDGGVRCLFIISVNPIDYLLMSVAKFNSCHNINGGGWRSGCIAYMEDPVTLVTYTLPLGLEKVSDETGEVITPYQHPEMFTKTMRNLFWWDEHHRLIQSRVYPQDNDGCADVRTAFRLKMQEMLSKANGWEPSVWTNRKRKFLSFTEHGHGATNYPDWQYEYMGANLSTPNHSADPYDDQTPFIIGVQPTCVVCGTKHSRSSMMTCSYSCDR